MFDYRIKVFYAVATRLSFTKAARELSISQSAVTKHIKEFENQLKTKLFDRRGSSIKLTQSGELLYNYSLKIKNLYRDLEFEINQINKKHKGLLRIGASTTIAQYILPEILAQFHNYYKEIKIELFTNNTEAISLLLEENKIDFGIIEGANQSPLLEYHPFKKDEIALVAKSNHRLANKVLSLNDLYNIEFVFREHGSGTKEFIQNNLLSQDIDIEKLNIVMQLGSSESIKNYLLHSNCFAFLSISTVLTELSNKTLTIVDIKNFKIERMFQFILQKGEQSELIKLFLKFANYNF